MSNDSTTFEKADTGKLKMHLIEPVFIRAMATVLTKGAAKYADGNWKSCEDTSRYVDALERHILAWRMGELKDPESGESHLAHAACNLMFLEYFEEITDTPAAIQRDYIFRDLLAELQRAETLHPNWPTDAVHAAAIFSEEAGELVRAVNDWFFDDGLGDGKRRDIYTEAIHAGAMILRFLRNFDGYKRPADAPQQPDRKRNEDACKPDCNRSDDIYKQKWFDFTPLYPSPNGEQRRDASHCDKLRRG